MRKHGNRLEPLPKTNEMLSSLLASVHLALALIFAIFIILFLLLPLSLVSVIYNLLAEVYGKEMQKKKPHSLIYQTTSDGKVRSIIR